MHKEQVTVQNFTPNEFELLIQQLTSEEGFVVTRSGIDTFSAHQGPMIKLHFSYNRNQNTLTVDALFSKWNPALDRDFIKDQVLRVLGKEDSTGKIQPTPLQGKDSGLQTTGVNTINTPPPKPAPVEKPVDPNYKTDLGTNPEDDANKEPNPPTPEEQKNKSSIPVVVPIPKATA